MKVNEYKNIYQESINILKTYPKFIKYDKPFSCNCYSESFIFDYDNYTISNNQKTYFKSLKQAIDDKQSVIPHFKFLKQAIDEKHHYKTKFKEFTSLIQKMLISLLNSIKNYLFNENKEKINKEAYDKCVKIIKLLPEIYLVGEDIMSKAHIDVKQVRNGDEIKYVLFNIDENKEWYYFFCEWTRLSNGSYYKWYFDLLKILNEENTFEPKIEKF